MIKLEEKDYVAARNRSVNCKHKASSLEVYEEIIEPSKTDSTRARVKLWCGECQAIKLYYRSKLGVLKSTDRYR